MLLFYSCSIPIFKALVCARSRRTYSTLISQVKGRSRLQQVCVCGGGGGALGSVSHT